MRYNRDAHHRRSIRLRGYDYSQAGSYFITVCTHQRAPLFGDVMDGVMVLNGAGRIAHEQWQNNAVLRADVLLGEFIIMPNHMHGIITVGAHCMRPTNDIRPTNDMRPPENTHVTEQGRVQRAPTVGDIVRGYKSSVTKRIWALCGTHGQPIWQRNYYEHIIRNAQAYAAIADYIRHNPQRWREDVYCCDGMGAG